MARGNAFALAALFLAALNLRPAITSIGPVLEAIRADTTLSHTLAGLLTSIPVLCMGILAPLAGTLAARRGAEAGVFWALVLIAVATAARLVGHASVLFVTALISGCGIAVAGPLLGAFIKRWFPTNLALVSGLYSGGLAIGAAVSAGLTGALAALPGSRWELALASWSLPAILGCALWYALARQQHADGARSMGGPVRLPWRHRRAWLLMLYFGFQSLIFYAVVTWLAPMYMDLGWSEASAGGLLSLLVAVQAVAAPAVSAAANRSRDRRPWLLVMGVLLLGSMLALVVMPDRLAALWMVLLGIGTGSLFALGLILPLDYSETPAEAGAWTAMMLAGGYVIAATGPFLAGAIRDLTGSYAAAFAMLSALAAVIIGLSTFLRPRDTQERRSP